MDLDDVDIKYISAPATFFKLQLMSKALPPPLFLTPEESSLKGTNLELVQKNIFLVVFTSAPWTLTGMKVALISISYSAVPLREPEH